MRQRLEPVRFRPGKTCGGSSLTGRTHGWSIRPPQVSEREVDFTVHFRRTTSPCVISEYGGLLRSSQLRLLIIIFQVINFAPREDGAEVDKTRGAPPYFGRRVRPTFGFAAGN